jgi:hypothetical protein
MSFEHRQISHSSSAPGVPRPLHPKSLRRSVIAVVAIVAVTTAAMIARPKVRTATDITLPTHRAIGALQPRIAPDGSAIAFSWQGAIWTTPRTGGSAKRLTSGDGFDIEPAWSPDSKQIAFINSRNFAAGELRLISASDGATAELRASVQAQGKLHFHPDGRRILGNFQAQAGRPESLQWLDRDGTLTPVLNPPRPVRRHSLSHDGRWVAFVTTLDAQGQQSGNDGPQNEVWKVSSGGGTPELIARFPARIHDTFWSADGLSLVITADLAGAHYDLWQLPLDQPLRYHKLTHGQADEDRPSISHDGQWLVYTDNRAGGTALVLRDRRNDEERMLSIGEFDYGVPVGKLQLRVVDESTGKACVARISLEQQRGKFYAPVAALYRLERTNGHFYCREQAELELPAGAYRLSVSRGPEYATAKMEIRVEAGKTSTESIQLKRWCNFSAAGYTSGENHIHANYGYGEWYNTPQSMLDQCEGEDLNICNFMVANSDTDGVFDRSFFRGEPDRLSSPKTILYWNQEFRSTIWGHMTLVNLRQIVEPVFTGFKDTTNPWDIPTNADIADRTHLQGGLVNYTHPAQNVDDPYLGAYTAKGLPVDIALGRIDSMDVMGSSHRATVPLWYRFLNCGFRVPASAGTDCFLNRIRSRLPGSDRAYVWSNERFSYAGWIEGLRAGRSFVTNGPFIELQVGGQWRPGDTVELNGPDTVQVTGRALSQFPLGRVELVYNGRVVSANEAREGDAGEVKLEQRVPLERSGWLALRVAGPGHPDHVGPELYAHTGPVYVTVLGRPAPAHDDAKFFLAWIDRLEAAIRERDRIPNSDLKSHVESQFTTARATYRKLIP